MKSGNTIRYGIFDIKNDTIFKNQFEIDLLKKEMSVSSFEFELMSNLLDKEKISIDVGAHLGTYTYYMIKNSKRSWAFEPNPQFFENLKSLSPNLIVKQIALSDQNGEAFLRIPAKALGRGTIEKDNTLEEFENIDFISVEQKKLDDYELETVGLIKIDVEGHELSVLNGAKNLLIRDKPALLIEAEERHKRNAVIKVRKFLEELDYKGFFLSESGLEKIENFQQEYHQNPRNIKGKEKVGIYINNFLFLPKDKLQKIFIFLK